MIPAPPGPRCVADRLALAVAFVAGGACLFAATPLLGKTHTLYMGADIGIEWKGGVHRIQDVAGDSFVIHVDGEQVVIPTFKRKLYMKIDDTLKVTRASVTIDNFRADRAYTPENDPRRKFHEAASMASGAAAESDMAVANMVQAEQTLGRVTALAANNPMLDLSSEVAHAQRNASLAAVQFNSSVLGMSNNLNSPAYHAANLQEELAMELFDAFEVSFDISTQQRFEKPYVILVVRYREEPNRPDTARNWVYGQVLPDLSERPRRVRLLRGGFPPGYHIENYHLHIYDQGVEIASNIARKRVELSSEEAFQFSVIEYIARHRDATLRPMPVKSLVPPDLPVRLAADQINRAVFVKVGKDGLPAAVFEDEGCRKKVGDSELEAALLELRFNPALEKGKPVEGVAHVALADVIF